MLMRNAARLPPNYRQQRKQACDPERLNSEVSFIAPVSFLNSGQKARLRKLPAALGQPAPPQIVHRQSLPCQVRVVSAALCLHHAVAGMTFELTSLSASQVRDRTLEGIKKLPQI